MKDQTKTALEKPLNQELINGKRLWVTPDIELISSDDIKGEAIIPFPSLFCLVLDSVLIANSRCFCPC